VSAVISDCGRYRYVLRRTVAGSTDKHRSILFIMLNPSTANEYTDDPTIRRCIKFAMREDATHMTVVNLFAFRATDPSVLDLVHDPVGPKNMDYLQHEIVDHRGSPVICAWGAKGVSPRAKFIIRQLDRIAADWCCLGRTKSGAPRHPLYVKCDQPLERFELESIQNLRRGLSERR